MNLTTASLNLFTALINDAGNWGGNPLLDLSKEERGNLTQLKRAKLLVTFRSEGCDWVAFTTAGIEFARSQNLNLGWCDAHTNVAA